MEIEPFPLLILPLDIQNIIASFLPFHDSESEQEFIERTKTKKEVPKECLTHLPKFILCSDLRIISAFCPHNKTIGLLFEKLNVDYSKSAGTLIFIDRHNNQKLYEKQVNESFVSNIALSCNTNILATIHKVADDSMYSGTIEVMRYKNILSIKNNTSQKEESYDIPNNFYISCNTPYPTIAFNKQGTRIILRGYDHEQGHYDNEEVYSNPLSKQNIQKPVHHKIFPLTTTLDQNSNDKKTLTKYFKQRAVCKDFIKQITCHNLNLIRQPSNASTFAIPMHEDDINKNFSITNNIKNFIKQITSNK